jgi:hypothetical protein
MKNKNFIPAACCFLLLQFFVQLTATGQDYAEQQAKADTVNFAVTKHNDWQLLNSYVGLDSTTGAVQLELIVLTNEQKINWKKEQYVGSIKPSQFLPRKEQQVSYSLLSDVINVKIKPDGKCYLIFNKSNPPLVFPVIIPVKVSYSL